ncbi:protein-export chaperone SecB [uncultured Porticoccus sp.]|uniref:protein-export chaperone SecB n=1 Tax=uncultured Porticoccus sp. TaxID=1256050 RepID=UPI00262C3387|nr:protein-export chaperone SecB [uncultured Porticoccus sp.]
MSQNEKAQTTPHFSMQKIYLKRNDYEAPNPSSVFKEDWKPEVTLDLDIKDQKLEDDRYEVILSISITANNAGQVAFRLVIDQAALFLISNFPDERLEEALGSACPAIMFPYLRETVDHMLLKGGFPPLMLAPVNFDALYREKKAKLN